jgi:hypothetical protein
LKTSTANNNKKTINKNKKQNQKEEKKIDYHLHNTMQKTKDLATKTPPKTDVSKGASKD